MDMRELKGLSAEVLNRTIRSKLWRLRNLYWVKPKDESEKRFEPNGGQMMVLRAATLAGATRVVVLKVRQDGISTLGVISHLDDCLHAPYGNMNAGLVDLTLDDAKKKIAIARFAFERLGTHDGSGRDAEIAREWGRQVREKFGMEDSALRLRWGNGSAMQASTHTIGSTVQRFHVSDAGEMTFQFPERMEGLAKSMEAIPEKGQIIVEGTHAGGKAGWFYETCRRALERDRSRPMLPGEYEFVFLPWFSHAEYDCSAEMLGMRGLTAETKAYFLELEASDGIVLSDTKKLWWQIKRETMARPQLMATQYPSTPAEAWNAVVAGSIYGDLISKARAERRVTAFVHERTRPLFTFWDIGNSDHTAIWLVQVAREVLWVDYYRNHRETPAHYADMMRRWEAEYGQRITTHFLPHDGKAVERGSGLNYLHWLAEAGIRNVAVVPVAKDKWDGINRLREILRTSVFHVRCDEPVVVDGEREFSGLAALEGYRSKKVETGERVSEEPVHDATSHTADAARTLAEAMMMNMVPTGASVRAAVRSAGGDPEDEDLFGPRIPPVRMGPSRRRAGRRRRVAR